MTPLSSFPSEEWRQLFDRYDIENNGRMDGKIPVQVLFTQNASVMAFLVGTVIQIIRRAEFENGLIMISIQRGYT